MKKIILLFGLLFITAPLYAQTCVTGDITKNPLQVQANWQDNSSNETGFVLERKLNSGAYAALVVGGLGSNITSYTDSTVSRSAVDNTYFYRVKAVNAIGDSPYSNEACITFAALLPPNAPSGLTLARGESMGEIQASWSDNSNNEDSFEFRLVGLSPPRTIARSTAANVTSLSITGLQKNKTFCGTVLARNAGGDSDPTDQSCATTRR